MKKIIIFFALLILCSNVILAAFDSAQYLRDEINCEQRGNLYYCSTASSAIYDVKAKIIDEVLCYFPSNSSIPESGCFANIQFLKDEVMEMRYKVIDLEKEESTYFRENITLSKEETYYSTINYLDIDYENCKKEVISDILYSLIIANCSQYKDEIYLMNITYDGDEFFIIKDLKQTSEENLFDVLNQNILYIILIIIVIIIILSIVKPSVLKSKKGKK